MYQVINQLIDALNNVIKAAEVSASGSGSSSIVNNIVNQFLSSFDSDSNDTESLIPGPSGRNGVDGVNGIDGKIGPPGIDAEEPDLPYIIPGPKGDRNKVVQTIGPTNYSTQTTSSSNAFADTGLTATITPTSTSNKVRVTVLIGGCAKYTGDTYLGLRLLRDAVLLTTFETSAGQTGSVARNHFGTCGVIYLDSPASVGALVYKVQFQSGANIATVAVQQDSGVSSIMLEEVIP